MVWPQPVPGSGWLPVGRVAAVGDRHYFPGLRNSLWLRQRGTPAHRPRYPRRMPEGSVDSAPVRATSGGAGPSGGAE